MLVQFKWSWPFKWTGYTKPKEAVMGNWKFFTDAEVAGLNGNLPAMLDMARGIAGVPFRLTATTGGKHAQNSAHYLGLAVDIGLGHMAEGAERDGLRWATMKGLYGAGFKRIEDAPCHIHADIGEPPDFVSPCAWIGTDS
jgi:hypothetical protein